MIARRTSDPIPHLSPQQRRALEDAGRCLLVRCPSLKPMPDRWRRFTGGDDAPTHAQSDIARLLRAGLLKPAGADFVQVTHKGAQLARVSARRHAQFQKAYGRNPIGVDLVH